MGVDYFFELTKQQSPQTIEAFTVRYNWLKIHGKKKEADKLRAEWSEGKSKALSCETYHDLWERLLEPKIDLSILPACSFFLQFTFTLAKPYISKDDNPFYIIDNPIVRDKVFKLPMVRPSGWKGNLYSALWQLGHDKKENDEQMRRIFGEIRSEESGQAGRLFFYPTFFTQMGLEIINPHDRKRRVGKNPILFEVVPAKATGTFSLLYVPFDRIGEAEAITRKQTLEDLRLIAEGLQAMFLTYGFSAKRTSGYGVAEERVRRGILHMRIEEEKTASIQDSTATHTTLPKYLQAPGKLKEEYLNADGTFRERSQAELAKWTKAQRQEYDKALKWWEREGKLLASQPPAESGPEKSTKVIEPAWLKREFDTFAQLIETVEALLRKQGGA